MRIDLSGGCVFARGDGFAGAGFIARAQEDAEDLSAISPLMSRRFRSRAGVGNGDQ